MEERVDCKLCGASILPQTAERCENFCRPCFNKETYKRIGMTPFGIAYERSFTQPHFNTDTFFNIWIIMELDLAGPFHNMRCKGHCDYVFRKCEERFPGVFDASSFKQWCLAIIEKGRQKSREIEIGTEKEKQDKITLLKKLDEMINTTERAFEVIKLREDQRKY